jgi:hypothetical protein
MGAAQRVNTTLTWVALTSEAFSTMVVRGELKKGCAA